LTKRPDEKEFEFTSSACVHILLAASSATDTTKAIILSEFMPKKEAISKQEKDEEKPK